MVVTSFLNPRNLNWRFMQRQARELSKKDTVNLRVPSLEELAAWVEDKTELSVLESDCVGDLVAQEGRY